MIVFPVSFMKGSGHVTSNLVLHYDPSNPSSYSGSGTTINDLSGNGLNGTMSNITFASPHFSYNGTNSQISVADNALLEPGTGDFTVEVWVNQAVAGNDVVLGKFNPGGVSSSVGYSIRTTSSTFYAQYGSGSGSGSTLFQNSTNHAATIGIWYQLVYVFTNVAANTFETFVNGSSIGSVSHSLASILNTSTNLYIGSYNNGEYAQWFDGKIGIVRIYNKALTSSEVLQNYNANVSTYGRGSSSNPGTSAQDIYNSGQTTSGWYYIKTSVMAQARRVYCNMTDESGGWMLIGYTPSFNNTNGGLGLGLGYPNTWENGEGTLNRLRASTMDLWYHNGSAQCTQVMKMATTAYNQAPLLANMTIANKVVYNNPSNLSLSTVSNYPSFVNNTPMTGTWSPIKGHTTMSTSLSVNAPGDWIYQAGVWWTVCGPSTQLQADGRSGNAQGTGSWTNPNSNALYGMANVATTANSLRTDVQSYAVYIK